MNKNEIRRAMLEQRSILPETHLMENSILTLPRLCAVLAEKQAAMVYLSFGGEADTFALIDRLWKEGKQVAVPVCDTVRFEIHPSVLVSMDELKPNRYGILEPVQILPPDFRYDAVIVPGVAFDQNGNRIGFGKGYYDKYLSSLNYRPLIIGLCHDFQVHEQIPSESHDIRMDMIVTEKRIVRVNA